MITLKLREVRSCHLRCLNIMLHPSRDVHNKPWPQINRLRGLLVIFSHTVPSPARFVKCRDHMDPGMVTVRRIPIAIISASLRLSDAYWRQQSNLYHQTISHIVLMSSL